MNENKEVYIKDFLILCLESTTLNEYYQDIGCFIENFEDLYTVTVYLIKRGIIVCYNKDKLLSSLEAGIFLLNENNWKEIPNHNELVLLENSGFDYYNKKIYENEIKEDIFPNFKVI